MTFFQRLRHELRSTLFLALPLVAGQLSYMLTAVADTIMIGRLGVTPLAAATFGNTLIHLPLMAAIGLAMSVSITVSQARGSNDSDSARSALRHGVYLALALSVLTLIGVAALLPLLSIFRQPPEVVAAAPGYLMLIAVSFVPAAASMMFKNHADAMNRPWVPLAILLSGAALNVFFNWLLIYGNWGLPAWGLEGAGVSTLLSRLFALAILIGWSRTDRQLRHWTPVRWICAVDKERLRRLWALGWPSSVQILAAGSAFVVATMIVGSMGAEALAAHQIVVACVTTSFMVPVGLGNALTVRMGATYGARDLRALRPILSGGWLMGGLFALVSVSCFIVFNREIAAAFVTDRDTQALAAGILRVAALFHLLEAMQMICVGALRGLGKVRFPAVFMFGVNWLVTIPIGCLLAYLYGYGIYGMWWGFVCGQVIMVLTFIPYVWRGTRDEPQMASPIVLPKSL